MIWPIAHKLRFFAVRLPTPRKARALNSGQGSRGREAAILAAGAVVLSELFSGGSVAVAQTTNYYFDTVHALITGSPLTGTATVTLGGYYSIGDGGGGDLTTGSTPTTTCTPNGGTIFEDSAGTCLFRVNPTNSVREWGAMCNVVAQMGNTA